MSQCLKCKFMVDYPSAAYRERDCAWIEHVTDLPDAIPPYLQNTVVPISQANPHDDCEAFEARS